MAILKTHYVPEEIEAIRLYDYAAIIFPTLPSRKAIKKAISREEITVNGLKTSTGYWVIPGDEVVLKESDVNPPKEYKLELLVVYEDDYMAVVNKPAGIPVSGNQYRTIQNALIGNLRLSNQEDALRWVKPVHRLDAATSGLLIVAKTAKALVKLGQQFEAKEIAKTYAAIVIGEIDESGNIQFEIDGLASESQFELLEVVPSLRNKKLSLVHLYPKTGRTHQLRIHLSKLGFPILGDQLYGEEGQVLVGKGMFLCAIGLQFHHPITNEPLCVDLPLPDKYAALMEREKRRWDKYN